MTFFFVVIVNKGIVRSVTFMVLSAKVNARRASPLCNDEKTHSGDNEEYVQNPWFSLKTHILISHLKVLRNM